MKILVSVVVLILALRVLNNLRAHDSWYSLSADEDVLGSKEN